MQTSVEIALRSAVSEWQEGNLFHPKSGAYGYPMTLLGPKPQTLLDSFITGDGLRKSSFYVRSRGLGADVTCP